MPRPRHDHISDVQVHTRLETPQSTPLDEFIRELPDAVRALVLAEPQPGDHAKPPIGDGRRVAVAAVQGETEHLAGGERVEVEVGVLCRRTESVQDIQRGEGCRVGHQGKGDQLIGRAPAEFRPDALIRAARLLIRRMR